MEDFYKSVGLNPSNKYTVNAAPDYLINKAVALGHGKLAKNGSLVVQTGAHTGRAANDKYVVYTDMTKDSVWWDNNLNKMTSENFQNLKAVVLEYLDGQDELFVSENSVGAHPVQNVGVRVVTPRPSAALFSNYLFRKMEREFGSNDFTILHAPQLKINPSDYGARNETVITTCFDTKTTIVIGSLYNGEIKKSMFCVLNYILPEMGILPMHAGANEMANGDVSVFFGLSGTGKTTLSTDQGTMLIGDDEHGLSDEGVFNFEGGCYAKTFELKEESEPGIWNASNKFGAILENVVMDDSGKLDFDDKSLSENGRSSYPLDFIDGTKEGSIGGVPKNIFFLTADAFGVLPPVAKLSKEQAMYYFVLGYTAKLAGTEIGVVEPQTTFSPCFGAPFMLRPPKVYADLLGRYIEKHNIQVWLVNTGWTGGVYGVGHRFPIKVTRQIIRTIQKNGLENVPTSKDPIFGLEIPQAVEGVEQKVLWPRECWEAKDEYDDKASKLATSFTKTMNKYNIQKQPEGFVEDRARL
ncbi:MAG: phosphoenolpyruvate carboxykinase (ATP) [Epsilonproteobacteria bacterium]|nr:MAG: phosphoenolpyruvate carboxykinase (ATP) [Campylobacterota bacterium]RLA65912.1 MAG: phosphoenolpyruvate carboxykinase (ATP) [Campylobacterota bacterium]